ncbi:MAG: hypothetical protein KAI71_02815 [Candidatus Pacebacteria bacterium]|nr:hypothetical protein [Candidatus Paceibacterota bacterium]
MEIHCCDECKCDIGKNDSFDLVFQRMIHGMKVPKLLGEFCSIKCMDKWRNEYRRGVTKTTEKENGRVKITFYNHELKRHLGSWEVQKENGKLCVKPDIWNEEVED